MLTKGFPTLFGWKASIYKQFGPITHRLSYTIRGMGSVHVLYLVKRPLWRQRNMFGAIIKIMWEEQLVDPPIGYIIWLTHFRDLLCHCYITHKCHGILLFQIYVTDSLYENTYKISPRRASREPLCLPFVLLVTETYYIDWSTK